MSLNSGGTSNGYSNTSPKDLGEPLAQRLSTLKNHLSRRHRATRDFCRRSPSSINNNFVSLSNFPCVKPSMTKSSHGLGGSSSERPWELEENGELVLAAPAPCSLSPASAAASLRTNPGIIRGPPSILRGRAPTRGRGVISVIPRASKDTARTASRADRVRAERAASRRRDSNSEAVEPSSSSSQRSSSSRRPNHPITQHSLSAQQTLIATAFASWDYGAVLGRRDPNAPRGPGAMGRPLPEIFQRRSSDNPVVNNTLIQPPTAAANPRPLTTADLYLTDARPPPLEPTKQHHKCAVCLGIKSHPVSYRCGHSHCYVCIRTWLQNHLTCPECATVMHVHPDRQYAEEHALLADLGDWDPSKSSSMNARLEPLTTADLYLTDARPPPLDPAKEKHRCGVCLGVKSHPVWYLGRIADMATATFASGSGSKLAQGARNAQR
ncbi:hypothetical protein C8R43DRAFT_1127134 [Mycena crocata]|nr:hypothetical protein C8R43DRAFT_1127134 [Mycena crocata]